MSHADSQLDHSPDAPSRDTGNTPPERQSQERRLETWQLCLIVAGLLVAHWCAMHCIVTWLGGEESFARGQASLSQQVADDGWRRTARGWEYLRGQAAKPQTESSSDAPSAHISAAQVWPAAAAACMILIILGLPDKKS